MINEEKLNMILKDALSPVAPDERMNQRLKHELEGKNMKKFSMKKVVICVAACLELCYCRFEKRSGTPDPLQFPCSAEKR